MCQTSAWLGIESLVAVSKIFLDKHVARYAGWLIHTDGDCAMVALHAVLKPALKTEASKE
jgi:hypothetical protein